MGEKLGEERVLVTDQFITRGWEAPELVAVGYEGTENLVMRTVECKSVYFSL